MEVWKKTMIKKYIKAFALNETKKMMMEDVCI